MTHPKEQVLVIPEVLARVIAPNLFNPVPPHLDKTLMMNFSFRDREEAETNFEFKQVIPYIVVKHGTSCLLSRRTREQQESRLHDKCSIGQGGHINELDMKSPNPILAGLLREISEEFTLGPVTYLECFGLINDNSNEVGRVHLGIVYVMGVDNADLQVAEQGKHVAQWATMTELKKNYEAMENWSKIVMDHVL